MGTCKIEVTAVGDHGRDRETKDGEVVNFYDEGPNTPDARAKTLLETMRAEGVMIEKATITHWPDEPSEVVDNLDTGKRKGNF